MDDGHAAGEVRGSTIFENDPQGTVTSHRI